MIFTLIIVGLLGMVKVIFGILPNVPATPTVITDGAAWMTDTIISVISFITYFVSAPLMAAVVLVSVAMFNFDWIYRTSMWIIRKIPMINMK